jgi:hypothetical protein
MKGHKRDGDGWVPRYEHEQTREAITAILRELSTESSRVSVADGQGEDGALTLEAYVTPIPNGASPQPDESCRGRLGCGGSGWGD